jgi:hypothetical protein
MTELNKGVQRGQGSTGSTGQPDGSEEQEHNRGAEFGAAERGTRGTDRDADETNESKNQGHGHPDADRQADGA